MTVRYSDYLNKVSAKEINLSSMYYNVKLVCDEYSPADTHKPADVQKYIINAIGVLQNDDILNLSMGEIIDRAKELIIEGLKAFQPVIASEIERVISDHEKRERLKLLMYAPDNTHFFWQGLKDNGIGYLVFEDAIDGILCFCEELSV